MSFKEISITVNLVVFVLLLMLAVFNAMPIVLGAATVWHYVLVFGGCFLALIVGLNCYVVIHLWREADDATD